ncbi:MAG TPA: DUF3618 domain-containing protein [Aeromicrobium sp.]|nr:DUF3618 domain-containing protein [Aeromicrobium sp.]
MASAKSNPYGETPDELAESIEQTRQRLSGTIDELVDMVKPANIVKRRVDRIKAHFVDPQTGPRYENIVPAATKTAGVIVGIIVLRRLLR